MGRGQPAQWKPVEILAAGEDDDQQYGEEEGGDGVADDDDRAGGDIEARAVARRLGDAERDARSEEHTSELQSLMRISYAVFCLKKKNTDNIMTPLMYFIVVLTVTMRVILSSTISPYA